MPTALYVDRQQFKSITPKVGRPKLFPAGVLEFVQHGNAVEQVAGAYQSGDHERLQGMEAAEKHLDRDEFNAAAEDGHGHHHRPLDAEALIVHQQAVGHAEKPESGEDGDSIRKSSLEGCFWSVCGGH